MIQVHTVGEKHEDYFRRIPLEYSLNNVNLIVPYSQPYKEKRINNKNHSYFFTFY